MEAVIGETLELHRERTVEQHELGHVKAAREATAATIKTLDAFDVQLKASKRDWDLRVKALKMAEASMKKLHTKAKQLCDRLVKVVEGERLNLCGTSATVQSRNLVKAATDVKDMERIVRETTEARDIIAVKLKRATNLDRIRQFKDQLQDKEDEIKSYKADLDKAKARLTEFEAFFDKTAGDNGRYHLQYGFTELVDAKAEARYRAALAQREADLQYDEDTRKIEEARRAAHDRGLVELERLKAARPKHCLLYTI